jgi:hypothetical protein
MEKIIAVKFKPLSHRHGGLIAIVACITPPTTAARLWVGGVTLYSTNWQMIVAYTASRLGRITRGSSMGRSIARVVLVDDKPNNEIHESEIVCFIVDMLVELAKMAEHELGNAETRERVLSIIATLEDGLICRNPKSLC